MYFCPFHPGRKDSSSLLLCKWNAWFCIIRKFSEVQAIFGGLRFQEIVICDLLEKDTCLFTHLWSKCKNSSVCRCVMTFLLFNNSWQTVGYVVNFLRQDTEIFLYYKVIAYIEFYLEFTPPPLHCSYIFNFLPLLVFLCSCLCQKANFLFIFHQNDWCLHFCGFIQQWAFTWTF